METEPEQSATVAAAAAGRDKHIKGEPTLYLQLKTRIWGINVFESSDRQRNANDVAIPNVVCNVDIHDGGRFPPNMAAFQLASKIYLVGGGGKSDDPNPGAYVYELCPKTSQLLIPTAIPHRLKGPKVNPIAENIAGKIHVLDRDLISPPSCYEVLEFSANSKSWNWNSLPPPPLPPIPNSTIPLYFVLAHKLFVQPGGHEEEPVAYFFDDSNTNSWIPIQEPLRRPPPSPSSTESDLPDFQLMGGRTLRNCPGFEPIQSKTGGNPLHVFVAYQGDFDVIGESKYLGAFLLDGEEARVVAYQSLEKELLFGESDNSGDFYPEEFPYGVVDLGEGVICAVMAGYRDDGCDVVRVCVLRLVRKPSWAWAWALEEEEEFLDVEVLEQREYGLDELEESLRSPVCSAFLV